MNNLIIYLFYYVNPLLLCAQVRKVDVDRLQKYEDTHIGQLHLELEALMNLFYGQVLVCP